MFDRNCVPVEQEFSIETDSLGETLRTQGANPGHSALLLQAGTQWIINEQWSANA